MIIYPRGADENRAENSQRGMNICVTASKSWSFHWGNGGLTPPLFELLWTLSWMVESIWVTSKVKSENKANFTQSLWFWLFYPFYRIWWKPCIPTPLEDSCIAIFFRDVPKHKLFRNLVLKYSLVLYCPQEGIAEMKFGFRVNKTTPPFQKTIGFHYGDTSLTR